MSVSFHPNQVIDIPDHLIEPSCEDRTVSYLKNAITIGGGTALAITAIFLGATQGISPLTIVTVACSAGFFALKIVDSRCGKGSKTAEIFQKSVKVEALELQQLQHEVAAETAIVKGTGTLATQDQTTVKAIVAINQAGAIDSEKLKQTVEKLQQGLATLASDQAQLENDLKLTVAEKGELKQRVDSYAALFNQLHTQVQKCSETIPDLQKIDLTWDGAIHTFEQNSSTVTKGFDQILTQMHRQSEENKTFATTIAQLETELKAIQELMMQKNNQITNFEQLEKMWSEQNGALNEEKIQLKALSKSVKAVLQASNDSSPQVDDLIEKNKVFIANQMKLLEEV